MTIKYFQNVKTVAELRSAYIKLLKENHPDNGGDTETCKAINAEYEYLLGRLPKTANGNTASSTAEARKDFQMDKAIREMLNNIIRFDGLNIEVVGSWIWVDGNSFPWKEELKGFGFQWSRARKKWHWTADNTAWHKGQKIDFEELRDRYGATVIENESKKAIA